MEIKRIPAILFHKLKGDYPQYLQKQAVINRHIGFYQKDKFLLEEQEYPLITDDEFRQIKETWPCFKYFGQDDLTWFRIYKKNFGFSPYFVDALQIKYILEKFNPFHQVISLENKAMGDVYFPEIPFPEVYVRCLNGVFYDRAMNRLTLEEAVKVLIDKECFIIKPSIDSLCGAGVEKVVVNDLDKPQENVKVVISRAGDNFIAQECLVQEPVVAALNPTSINCCRITTMYMNGKFGYSSIIKIGKKGSHVDNWHSSYFTGMAKDGTILPHGFDKKCCRVTKTDNGIEFGGIKVPCFEKMVELVEKCHKYYFANCGVIGWDIMVDSNNNPRVLEMNISCPGVVGEQLASGPFFEVFRDEICKSLLKK